MRDVIFDENSFYKSSQIDFAQLIKELFLINSDMIDILKIDFIKIKELSDIIDEENFQNILIDVITIIEKDLAKATIEDN